MDQVNEQVRRFVDERVAGLRLECETALLEQVASLVRRSERLEALLAEHVGRELVVELLESIA